MSQLCAYWVIEMLVRATARKPNGSVPDSFGRGLTGSFVSFRWQVRTRALANERINHVYSVHRCVLHILAEGAACVRWIDRMDGWMDVRCMDIG